MEDNTDRVDSEFGLAEFDPEVSGEEAFRSQLYAITTHPEATPDTKLQRLLELGRRYLESENGHIVAIDREANHHEVEFATGSDLVEVGTVSSLDRTYCRRTIVSDDILAIHDAVGQGLAEDPAFEAWGISTYIGSKLFVDRDLYGTVCFVDTDPRNEPFTQPDRQALDLLAQAVSRIIERDIHQANLQHEQELFQLFIDEVDDYAMFMLDPDGYITSWNSGASVIYGFEKDTIIGEHLSTLYPEDACEKGLPSELLTAAHQHGRVEDEGWRLRADDSQFWALVSITAIQDGDGAVRGFGKVTRDLTERRMTTNRLETEQTFIEESLNALEDIFYHLSAEGSIERVNRRAVEVSGYTEDELRSMSLTELFVPADRDRVAQSVTEALETGASTVEATVLTKGGERRPFEFRGRRLSDSNESVTGIVGMGRDITEQQLDEERLDVTQRVLRHNLRNDMTTIRGWAQELREQLPAAEQDGIDQIIETADRLIDLTEKTRVMAELDDSFPLTESGGDVDGLLNELIGHYRSRHPAATIEYTPPDERDLQVASFERLEKAISNALENAIEHNPAPRPWVGVDVTIATGQIVIEIHDDGPTIPAVERRVLSDGQETPLEHGSGMGLWLIHWCVATLGGEVAFEERAPVGNTISIRVPHLATR